MSSHDEQGPLSGLGVGLLPVVLSPLVEHELSGTWASAVATCGLSSSRSRALEHRLSSHGAGAELLRGMWVLPTSGIDLVSPALAGGFFTTEPSRKAHFSRFLVNIFIYLGQMVIHAYIYIYIYIYFIYFFSLWSFVRNEIILDTFS